MWSMMRIFILSVWLLGACKSDAVEPAIIDQPTKDTIVLPNVAMDFVMGKFDPSTHPDFVRIDPAYADKEGLFLQKEALEAFLSMHDAAAKDGIQLVIRSATRNFDYQKGIWERKWSGETKLEGGVNAAEAFGNPVERAKKILEYSSMPGSSRHHWGTDVDLNNFENSWFEEGEGLQVFQWLEAHAENFGFCRPYSAKDASRPNGYNEEKWHWSYIPLAKKYTDAAAAGLKNEMIKGFAGADAAGKIDIVQHYVLGINKACL